MDIIAIITALLALIILIWMGWIDLKLWILPNELVAFLAAIALPFHFSTDWAYGGLVYMVMGSVVGGGTLMAIRAVANRIYGMETMGLGDVKLLAAGGLWLGPQFTLMALSLGAFCGVIHAIILALKNQQSLNRMMLPAGPGFIAGLIITGIYAYKGILL